MERFIQIYFAFGSEMYSAFYFYFSQFIYVSVSLHFLPRFFNSKETSVNSDINQTNIQNHKLILRELREELTQQIKKYYQILIDYENTLFYWDI